MRQILSCVLGLMLAAGCSSMKGAAVVDVADFGAVGDGETLNTDALQSAINACVPGGTVLVSSGQYVTGTLKLKSDMTLHVAEGAALLGSHNLDDYARDIQGAVEAPAFDECLIYAENAENLTLSGKGTIDGRATREIFPEWISKKDRILGDRPMLIRFVDCKNVRFQDISLKNAASWCTHLVNCDDVVVKKVYLDSRQHKNNDGFDLDGCRNVLFEDCTIFSGDDAICPKSTTERVGENLTVRNCRAESHTAAVKCGTSSRGGWRNIDISDCDFSGCRMGVIKLMIVDGGVLENVRISNIKAENVEGPLFIRLGNRGRDYLEPTEQIYGADVQPEGVPVGTVRNIRISNFKATVTGDIPKRQGILISGIPGYCIEDVVLENVEIVYDGGGTAEDAAVEVPEREAQYPEAFFFGKLPAWGAYIRHAKNVTFDNVKMSTLKPDARERLVLVDAEGFSEK